MNLYADHIVDYLFAQSWQIAIVTGIVGLLSFTLRNRSAHLRYLLWLIVLAKCLVPPLLPVPLAVLPERSVRPFVGGLDLPAEYAPREIPVVVSGDVKSPDSTAVGLNARGWAAVVWAAGVAVFLLWVGGRAVRYTSWLRLRRKALLAAAAGPLRAVSDRFRFRRLPRIWLLDDVSQPFVWGVFRGSIYLPANFAALARSDQQRSILAHELSHVARFDAGVNLLQVLAQAVYWFHPFVWWANQKIRQEREKCCDEMAVAYLGTLPEHYTEAIVDALAAERRSAHSVPSLAIVGSVRDIEERIKTMLKPGRTFRIRPSIVATTAALLIALVTIPTALVLTARGQGQPPSQSMASENPEQPRYGARTFNSELPLLVSVKESDGMRSPIGITPSATPLRIPACWCWTVVPLGPVQDWSTLAREISLNKIPGLLVTSGTDSDLKYLADLIDLRELVLAGPKITDAGLEHLKGLSELEVLDLGRTQITDAGLAYLKGLTGLRQLLLASPNITGAGLQHLQGLTKLEQLSLGGPKVTDASLAYLQGLAGLRILNLNGPGITDASLEHLQGLKELRSLVLANTRVTGQGLIHLGPLTGLESLSLAGCPVTDAGLAPVSSLKNLRHLGLSKTRITDAGLAHVSNLTALEGLGLDKTGITSAGLEHLKALTALSTLGLDETQITDAGLEHVQGLKGLQRLWLDQTQVGDTGLAYLKGLTRLQELTLEDTQVTDGGLKYLQDLKGLRKLWLDNTQIGDAGIEHLKGLTELVMLELVGLLPKKCASVNWRVSDKRSRFC